MKYTAAFTAIITMLFAASCGSEQQESDEVYPDSDTNAANVEAANETEEFYYIWQGETLNAENVIANGCIMLDYDADESSRIWNDFESKLNDRENVSVTICSETSVTMVTAGSDGGEYTVQLKTKELSGEKLVDRGQVITPAVISCVRNEETQRYEYYISNIKLYSKPYSENTAGHEYTPAEFSAFEVSVENSEKNMTFPYQNRFTSFSDFENYYEQNSGNLELGELYAAMESFHQDGGFNDHIVFLYGDSSVSPDVTYDFLRAVRNNGELNIYLRKSTSSREAGAVKWQLICSVPSVYLADVSPDRINWIIYNDIESRS